MPAHRGYIRSNRLSFVRYRRSRLTLVAIVAAERDTVITGPHQEGVAPGRALAA